MGEKILNKNGITLIALVITIIVLLLLAGVTIATLTGKNDFIKREKQVKLNYSEINRSKEKIELAISDLMAEKTGKGERLVKEDLTKINSEDIDVKSTDNFPVEVISQTYKFNVDENFTVTYVEEANETIVTYTTEPEDYIKEGTILIKIKVSNPNGLKKIRNPKGLEISCNGKTTVGMEYSVNTNGTYTFKIIDLNGNETFKDIVIDKFDKIRPEIKNTTIDNVTKNGFTITVEAVDGEATEESGKSGIDRYEYYINDGKYDSKDNVYNIEDLKPSTEYIVYVIVYDKAGNSEKTENMSMITKENNIIKYLYKTGNEYEDITGGWKSFLQSNATCTKTDEDVYMKSESPWSGTQTLTTNKKINITDYKKIIVKANCISFKQSERPGRFGIYDKIPTEAVFDEVSKYQQFLPNGIVQEYELDISKEKGEKAIIIYGQPEVYIYEVYLDN